MSVRQQNPLRILELESNIGLFSFFIVSALENNAKSKSFSRDRSNGRSQAELLTIDTIVSNTTILRDNLKRNIMYSYKVKGDLYQQPTIALADLDSRSLDMMVVGMGPRLTMKSGYGIERVIVEILQPAISHRDLVRTAFSLVVTLPAFPFATVDASRQNVSRISRNGQFFVHNVGTNRGPLLRWIHEGHKASLIDIFKEKKLQALAQSRSNSRQGQGVINNIHLILISVST
jgi:hypothetical protein